MIKYKFHGSIVLFDVFVVRSCILYFALLIFVFCISLLVISIFLYARILLGFSSVRILFFGSTTDSEGSSLATYLKANTSVYFTYEIEHRGR